MNEEQIRRDIADPNRMLAHDEYVRGLLDALDAERAAHAQTKAELAAEETANRLALDILTDQWKRDVTERDYLRDRLAAVERERDELRAEYDDRERRARRQERDLMRESQDARLATLTATLREVREAIDGARTFITREYAYDGGEAAYRGEVIPEEARHTFHALCDALARCDALLKK